MDYVLLTAAFVGGATILGGGVGLMFSSIGKRANDAMLSFAAGVMLSAAIIGLILPSLDGGVAVCIIGIFLGAGLVNLLDLPLPYLMKQRSCFDDKLRRAILFVMAIALHNLPEGIAAGVGLGTGDSRGGMMIAIAIAMQNIPEGMVIISPMILSGVSKGRTFWIALMTGLVEVVGTFIGYFAAGISAAVLPFCLAFAGGTMLYVISDEMIPETHSHGYERLATYALLFGFLVMVIMDTFLG
jgi:ZIP family zinc transporter